MALRRHDSGRFGRVVAVGDRLASHPVAVAASVGAVLRVAFALTSFVINRQNLIGDELQYVQLAQTVADGKSAESWFPQFGQALYDKTWVFIAPIRVLFDLFGPSRLWGQLYAVTFGVLAVALAARLALEVVDRRLALAVGLVVAVLPSQVLWSSVVLRESMVWSAVLLVALGFTFTFAPDQRRAAAGVALCAVGLFLLGDLRDQTLVAMAWALPLAAVVAGGRRQLSRCVAMLAIAVVLPIVGGTGPAGWHLVQQAVPSLGVTRTLLGDEASSSFTNTTLLGQVPTTVTTLPGTAGPTTTSTVPLPEVGTTKDGTTVIKTPSGNVYVVDDGFESSLKELPRGLVAVVLRPFPWEHGSGPLRLAAVESIAWYALYALALVGATATWRRRQVLALPAIAFLALAGSAAVSQGNLGTAFRHRGQVVWAVALFAAVGVDVLRDRRRTATGGVPASDLESEVSV